LLDRYDSEVDHRVYSRNIRKRLEEISLLLGEMERLRKAAGGLAYSLKRARELHDAIAAYRQESRRVM
jgi:hypothetical protein